MSVETIDGGWFDIACRRIEAEARQPRLPIAEAAAKPIQASLTLDMAAQ